MRLCHAKVLPLQQKSDSIPHWSLHQPQKEKRKGARVAEEARLESVYTSKAYRGFESPSFRKIFNVLFLNFFIVRKDKQLVMGGHLQ